MATTSDLKAYLNDPNTRPLILDGGLGSQLEDSGYDDDMNDVLWSTMALFKYPDVVKKIYTDFLQNGADVITTDTYQASEAGLAENKTRLGLKDHEEVAGVFHKAIRLADEARDQFWAALPDKTGRSRPLVGGSVGPFGAYKADRSEYTGYYPSIESDFEPQIRKFHQMRLQILVHSDAVDFTMLETIPNFRELKVLVELIYELNPAALYTISLSLKAFDTLADGTDLKDVMAYLCGLPDGPKQQILAVGTNCSPLLFSHKTLQYLQQHNAAGFGLIVYPNSGEVYHKDTRTHSPDPLLQEFAAENGVDRNSFHDILAYLSRQWVAEGAKLVGGCCRITPQHIKWIHDSVL